MCLWPWHGTGPGMGVTLAAGSPWAPALSRVPACTCVPLQQELAAASGEDGEPLTWHELRVAAEAGFEQLLLEQEARAAQDVAYGGQRPGQTARQRTQLRRLSTGGEGEQMGRGKSIGARMGRQGLGEERGWHGMQEDLGGLGGKHCQGPVSDMGGFCPVMGSAAAGLRASASPGGSMDPAARRLH